MVTNKEIRQANIASCYEMAAEAITECSGTLDFAMSALERSMNEAELANDKRYTALCGVYESMREMMECKRSLKSVPDSHSKMGHNRRRSKLIILEESVIVQI